MEMTERMDDGVRDHECANEHVPACERGKEKGGDALVSRLSRCSFRRGIIGGELSSDYSRIRMAVLDLEKKHRPERRHRNRAGEAVCVAHFSVVSANGRTIPKSPGSRSRTGATTTDGIVACKRSERREGPSLLLSANSSLLKPQSSHDRRMCGLSGPGIYRTPITR